MRLALAVLAAAIAAASASHPDYLPARQGKRTLAILDSSATKKTHSVFFADLAGTPAPSPRAARPDRRSVST